jgi:cell division protein FtsB
MRHTAVDEELNDPRFSEVVELDDGTRLTARAAHLRDQLEASERALRQMDQVDRRWKIAGIVVAALLILAVTFAIARTNGVEATVSANSGKINNLNSQISQLQSDGNALEKQVRSLGAQPVVTVPPPQAGPPGVAGKNGNNGLNGETPSDEKLLGLIRTVIAENPPKDGKTPTAEELLAIIKPLIPQAIPGPQGVPGETPSDQRLLDLIKPLIPEPIPGPKGEPGKPGETGATGQTGPQGVPGPTCPEDFSPQQHQDTDALGSPVGPVYIRCEKSP